MQTWLQPLLPFMTLLARNTAFLMVLPIFGWRALPARVKMAVALLLTVFIAKIVPPSPAVAAGGQWTSITLLLLGETVCGLALGMSVRLVYLAAELGGRIAARNMGMALASTIDPTSGEQDQPMAAFFGTLFLLFFLVSCGHHLLIRLIVRSYEVFPVGAIPSLGQLAQAVLVAGSTMLLFALKLAAPVMAAFLCLSVFLSILARVLPEMNILFLSLPMRVGLGLIMAGAMVPGLSWFNGQLAEWIRGFLIS